MTDFVLGLDLAKAKFAAREIYEQSLLANEHAISGAHQEWVNSSVSDIHRHFASLARSLGYSVERVEPEA